MTNGANHDHEKSTAEKQAEAKAAEAKQAAKEADKRPEA